MTYTEWTQSGGKKVVGTTPFFDKIFDFIPKEGKILDVGCGNGRTSKLLHEHGFQVYGIDLNTEAVFEAQTDHTLAGIDFSVQNATSTNYKNDFFDGIIEQAVLACMEKVERSKMLSEMHRILKLGDFFSITEFGIREGIEERYETDAITTGEYRTVWINGSEERSKLFRSHHFEKKELEELIINAGFEIVMAHENLNFITRSGNKHLVYHYIVRKI